MIYTHVLRQGGAGMKSLLEVAELLRASRLARNYEEELGARDDEAGVHQIVHGLHGAEPVEARAVLADEGRIDAVAGDQQMRDGSGDRLVGTLNLPSAVFGTRPLVVLIHGGPSGAATPRWPEYLALGEILASQDYYVLMPNPRGSYGQGEEFTQANVKDFGGWPLSAARRGLRVSAPA